MRFLRLLRVATGGNRTDMTMNQLFGLWGGRPPGGWCMFITSAGPRGNGYTGTREEAESGKDVFHRERAESIRKYGSRADDDCTYDVVMFDPEREPEAAEDVPTEAQARFMREIDITGDFNRAVLGYSQWQSTSRALHDKGWTFYDVTTNKLRLTKAGRTALARAPGLGT